MLGTAINSMHLDHRKEFVRVLVSKYPEVVIGKLEFEVIANELTNYIQYSIVIPAKQLLAGSGILNNIVGDEIYRQVGFEVENNSNQVNSIQSQTGLIQQHLEIVDQLDSFMTNIIRQDKGAIVFESVSEEATEPLYLDMQREKRFERLFTNKYLPIEL